MLDPMKYGKARGTALLNKYLPEVTPIESMNIIASLEDWEGVKEKYSGFAFQRVDWPIDTPKPNAIYGTNGRPEDIPGLLEAAKKDCSESVVLLMKTKKESVYRYDYDGGFNVLFVPGKEIVIELVGKAFDGHELTYGLATHERYTVPWGEVLFATSKNIFLYGGRVVEEQDYAKQRAERVSYLTKDCSYDLSLVEERVPMSYRALDKSLIDDLLDRIVVELYGKTEELLREAGLEVFCVQGNFVNGEVQPWEIFVPKRWAK